MASDWGTILGKTADAILGKYGTSMAQQRKIAAGFNRTLVSGPKSAGSYAQYWPIDVGGLISGAGNVQRRQLPSGRGGGAMARNIYGDVIPGDFGGDYAPAPRRRRRGITARDLASFRRVANLIRKYAAPVRHFRHTKRGR